MIMVQAGSEVPKLTVMCNGSFGAGNYGMCGRAFDARLMFSWPNSQISVMGADQAAGTLTDIKVRQLERDGQELLAEERGAIHQSIADEYGMQSSAYYATSELWDDGMIDPVDTRGALGIAIASSMNAPVGDGSHNYGTLRF